MTETREEKQAYAPLELMAELNATMSQLSGAAWKVVSNVGLDNLADYVPGLEVPYVEISVGDFCKATGLTRRELEAGIREAIMHHLLERSWHRQPHDEDKDVSDSYRLRWRRPMKRATLPPRALVEH